jgi:hypothetical protein
MMQIKTFLRPLGLYMIWHTVYWLSDQAYYHLCAKGYLWSLVARDSDMCRTLKMVTRTFPLHG